MACSPGASDTACGGGGNLGKGDPLPACTLETLDGEDSILLTDLTGSTRVINFWASWCLSCLKEMPELDAFDKEREDVEVIGVDVVGVNGETVESGRRYFDERGVSYQSLVDIDGGFYSYFSSVSRPIMPLTIVVGEDNTVRAMRFGEVTQEILAEMVDAPAS